MNEWLDTRPWVEAERKAVNTLVQGSAADMMKAAMLRWICAVSGGDESGGGFSVHASDVAGKADPSRVRLVAQIHDELLFECEARTAAIHTHTRAHFTFPSA